MDVRVLTKTDAFPLRHQGDVYSGKVRSLYWLTAADSRRLLEERGYPAHPDAALGLMIISDKISAFECNWKAAEGLHGVPGKGAALNAISLHWFRSFAEAGLAGHHVLEAPHPLVWIIQKARPLRFEAIARQYITGSLWRAYARGAREFCGHGLPEGLGKNQKLDSLLITPSTKGTLYGLEGVLEREDTPISEADILRHAEAFGLRSPADLHRAHELLRDGFAFVSDAYAAIGQILVDTKFEFGFVDDPQGQPQLIFMDEVGTPDSSRLWETKAYGEGRVVESCKEGFRQYLLEHYDSAILTDSSRMDERKALARETEVPVEVMEKVSATYTGIAEAVTGQKLPVMDDPEAEILQLLEALKLREEPA